MATRGAPDWIRALPAAMRKLVSEQCEGDWRRLTRSPDGSVTIHNQPQFSRVELPPAVPRKRRASVVMGKAAATPPLMEAPSIPVRAPEQSSPPPPPATFMPAATPHAEPERPSDAEEVRLLGDPNGAQWDWFTKDDERLMRGAHALAMRCANGIPSGVRVKLHRKVLETYGLDFDDANAVMRHPMRVTIAPETKEKKYPVLRFTRGDVQTVVGFQRLDQPAVIAIYVGNWVADNESNNGGSGGGGSRKESGPPKTPSDVIKRLVRLGAYVTVDRDGETAVVKYHDQELGKISVKAATPRATCDSDWNRMQRKIGAINAR